MINFKNEYPTKSNDPYISFSREETKRLRQLNFKERALYFELKWLANFQTGQVGAFRNQKLSFAVLAEKLSLESSQGRAEQKMSAKEISRMLDRLVTSKLVDPNILNDGRLIMRLPISPLRKEGKSATKKIAVHAKVHAGKENLDEFSNYRIASHNANGKAVTDTFGSEEPEDWGHENDLYDSRCQCEPLQVGSLTRVIELSSKMSESDEGWMAEKLPEQRLLHVKNGMLSVLATSKNLCRARDEVGKILIST